MSIRCSERLAEADIKPSVGSKGDSYDNALAGVISGLHKAELVHHRAPWKTKEPLELATPERVSCFKHHRLLGPRGTFPLPKPRKITIDSRPARQPARLSYRSDLTPRAFTTPPGQFSYFAKCLLKKLVISANASFVSGAVSSRR